MKRKITDEITEGTTRMHNTSGAYLSVKWLTVTDRLGLTPLHEAVGSESAVPEVIRAMIDVIVKANNWSLVDAVDDFGNTALHVAARRGQANVIPELAALNPKTKNTDGDTPFHLAARAGHPFCVEAMLQVK